MDSTKNPMITTEISGIWNAYMGESQVTCILKYFEHTVEDDEIHNLLQQAISLSNNRIKKLTDLFQKDKLPVPIGFTDDDVNLSAPRLFTDALYLQYLWYISKIGLTSYSYILSSLVRPDLRRYFIDCILESTEFSNKVTEVSLTKGLFIKAPRLEVAKSVQFVKSKGFMIEWFGKKRAMLADEIAPVYGIINDDAVRIALTSGFAQVCHNEEILKFIAKTVTHFQKRRNDFTSIFTDEKISFSNASDNYLTDSTVSPFSDKLMLNKILIMYRVKIIFIGLALSQVARSDIKAAFMKYLNDALQNAQEALTLLIENGWLEQPPQIINHESLIGV